MSRYRIYAGGVGWSVSLKYALPCKSTLLVLQPIFYDFLTRGLLGLKAKGAVVIPRYYAFQATKLAIKHVSTNF